MPPVSGAQPGVRYRFGPFVLSPGQRLLLRDGAEIRLIPRYFDLLVLLIERRSEAVSRQEIFDWVWADVVVSDGALSQAGAHAAARARRRPARAGRSSAPSHGTATSSCIRA